MYETRDRRETTSRSTTLDDAIGSAVNAWTSSRDPRTFTIVNPSGLAVAVVKQGVVDNGRRLTRTEPAVTALPTHPLLAHIPAADLRGAIVQAIPAGEGVVTVSGTDSAWGACEVTAWRPVPQWEIDMLAREFPGEPQPLAVSVSSRILQDDEDVDAAITEAVEFLTTYLARAAA